MVNRRFDRTDHEDGPAIRLAPAPRPNLALEAPTRYECRYCGAHVTGALARATGGRFCSTCGGKDLVAIEERLGPGV